jgi:hypothetical protein
MSPGAGLLDDAREGVYGSISISLAIIFGLPEDNRNGDRQQLLQLLLGFQSLIRNLMRNDLPK